MAFGDHSSCEPLAFLKGVQVYFLKTGMCAAKTGSQSWATFLYLLFSGMPLMHTGCKILPPFENLKTNKPLPLLTSHGQVTRPRPSFSYVMCFGPGGQGPPTQSRRSPCCETCCYASRLLSEEMPVKRSRALGSASCAR